MTVTLLGFVGICIGLQGPTLGDHTRDYRGSRDLKT